MHGRTGGVAYILPERIDFIGIWLFPNNSQLFSNLFRLNYEFKYSVFFSRL
jgi:hypothetical protein